MKHFITAIFFCFSVTVFAQIDKNDILFTVDEEPVMASEFVRVYNKNLDLVKDESQKDVDAYLELFINYQLKVKEARRLELDKDAKYIREFTNYKSQLTKNFLSDSKVTETLVKEAYDRSTEDIKASHVLIRIEETNTDTTQVYNRLLELRQRIMKEGYDVVKNEVHNGKTVFAEDLGYFSVFKMVYAFETAAYNTKIGEVSMPFRTRFGFHIVNVTDKRPSLGEVTVAHIMVANNQKDTLLVPETRINEIYKKLQQGEKFESLAKQFSDDKSSSSKGGQLAPFTGGQLGSQEFEDMAFSLKDKGQVSEPFKTDFGWHIVKLIGKSSIQPYEKTKAIFENKVKRDSRSKLINTSLAKQLDEKYKVVDNKDALSYFETIINDSYFKQAWIVPVDLEQEKIFLTIGTKKITYGDFAQHLFKIQRTYANKKMSTKALINSIYSKYKEDEVILYNKENLEFENEDFAHVLKEYRDGLLLFDLMEKQVWNAASKDTVGLKAFHANNKDNYMWEDRVEGVILSSANKNMIEKAIKLLNKGKTIEAIEAELNKDEAQNIISTSDIFELGDKELPKDFEFKEGISKVYEHNDAYHVIMVKTVISKSHKTLDAARGKIVSDYQNQIENDWIKSLNERYNVKVDHKVLKKVKSLILN
ncbi:peptidylprolyl isomerase [Psychroserpens ponticola]|uniref:Peptidylprolyl isomerase n=1 Tax=Psychroserpens ponticola TaxID=2932268 RepID=A0ABY7S0S2_9FLAO|nr:peptidylprolyl isomerase [Psychroserpens ponticola]WCO02764.1 peptidylprolyl isomerase [Psychroserpens ponticola]